MKTIPEIQKEQNISRSMSTRYGQKLRKKLANGDFGVRDEDWEYREFTSPHYYVGPKAEKKIIAYAKQMGWLNTA